MKKGPTRSAPTKDGPKLPQKGDGRMAKPPLRWFKLSFGGKLDLIL